ncbi:hypothetical protein ACJIZ3_002205 [Penstemon smallii]|uniref:DUF569 domain-containing protein n=1 Tax=Penstemon smallii TaxID=265156 RepID=A0ABD3U5U5_9LAMI
MDLFLKAKSVRLRSYDDKYLVADEDRETISQDRNGPAKNTLWTVEFVEGEDYIRLKSCFGTYLTASNIPFLPGVTGKKVVQTRPSECNPTTQWEPLRDGMQVRLKSLRGNFLRPNGGLPPWRNSVTHDIPHRNKTHSKILWDVEVVEKRTVHRKTQSDMIFRRTKSASASMKKQISTSMPSFFRTIFPISQIRPSDDKFNSTASPFFKPMTDSGFHT